MLKKILILLTIMASLLIITGGVVYFLISREIPYETTPTTTSPLPVSPLPPELIQKSPEAAQKLEEKINTFTQTINEASKAGVKKEVSIQITEGEVNSLIEKRIQEGIPELPIKIKDMNVQLRDGLAQVNMIGVFMGVTINALTTVEVILTDGKPNIIVKDVNLGRVPLPGAIKNRLKDIINEQSKKIEMTELPFEFKDIVIKDGQIFIQGTTKP
ncbi:MAG: hypothetical protein DDT31_01079 [Syntrophomonadaceae bacterium]|nr:hypothetical protein [Bacillota bacterium]